MNEDPRLAATGRVGRSDTPRDLADRKNNASVHYALGSWLKRAVQTAVKSAPENLRLRHGTLLREFDALYVRAQSDINRALARLGDLVAPPNSNTPERQEWDRALMVTIVSKMAQC